MKYVITVTEVSPTNNPPIVVDYGDCEEAWNREKFDWAMSHEWNEKDKFGIIKYSDGSELRVDVVKVISPFSIRYKG